MAALTLGRSIRPATRSDPYVCLRSCLCRRRHNHDLRHTFGTLAVRGAESIVELQNWLGHAEVRTTMRYTHYREQQDAAVRLAAAFKSRPREPSGEGAEPPAAEPARDG
jgi:integrase